MLNRDVIIRRANKLSAQEILAAIRKDGYEKGKGQYIFWADNEVVKACAYGQAALNLAPKSWTRQKKTIFASEIHHRAMVIDFDAFVDVIRLNDTTSMTLPEIADSVEKQLHAEV